MVLAGSLDTLKSVSGHIQEACEIGRSWRLTVLFKSIDRQLREKHCLDAGSMEALVKGSHEESFRETVYKTATKAILSESNLAVRVMAVIAAKHIADRSSITYDDLLLLRGLQSLTDEEIILGMRIWKLYCARELPLDPITKEDSEEHQKYVQRHIAPSEGVITTVGVDDYVPKVEALKKAGALGDTPHGHVGQNGGWGHVMIIPRTELFGNYVSLAQGLPSTT
jgi:hypothetical protein